jgi:hypothetical protein
MIIDYIGGVKIVKMNQDLCDDEGRDNFEDYYLESPDTYYLGKLSADSCDEYWDELAGSN